MRAVDICMKGGVEFEFSEFVMLYIFIFLKKNEGKKTLHSRKCFARAHSEIVNKKK